MTTPAYDQHNPYFKAWEDIWDEINAARKSHAPMHGAHEGWAVIYEELDELWDEVKAKKLDKAKAYIEAKQVAAMALAFMVEVCGGGS